MEHIETRFKEFCEIPYPNVDNQKFDWADLMLMDAHIAGHVSNFISSKGKLKEDEMIDLKKSLGELDAIVKELIGEPARYFKSLLDLGTEVIELIKSKKPPEAPAN